MTTPFPCRLLNEKDLLRRDLIAGKRTDGRSADTFREGSFSEHRCKKPEDVLCIARIGTTRVSCCLSPDLREADPDLNLIHLKATYPGDFRRTAHAALNDDDSDHEVDMDNLEDRNNAISLERETLLETLIEEFDVIDESSLVLLPGRVVVHLYITINVLHADGCVIDTAFLALVASLQRLRLPKWSYDPTEDSFSFDWDNLQSAQLLRNPQASSTFAVIGTTVICGPTAEEEQVVDAVVLAVAQDDASLLFFQVIDGSLHGGFTGEPLTKVILAANQQKISLLRVLNSPPSDGTLVSQDKIVSINRTVKV